MHIDGGVEGLFGAVFFIAICCEVMFGIYIAKEVLQNGYSRARLQAAISIAVFVCGAALVHGWLWWWLHHLIRGVDVGWKHPILVIGLVIEDFGIVCMIRVFAPDAWGRYVWAIFALLSVASAGIFTLI